MTTISTENKIMNRILPFLLVTSLALIYPALSNSFAESKKDESEKDFVKLFNGKDFTGWIGNTKGYEAKDGVLICPAGKGKGGNIFTEKQYDNFIYRFEFKLTAGANNGVGIRTTPKGKAFKIGFEVQVLDNTAEKYAKLQPTQYHGSLYKCVAAKRGHLKPVGQWNVQEIKAAGQRITVTLNGVKIIDDADVTKFKRAKNGHIGFLGHGSLVEFRNLRIKTLPGQSK
jgi:hypothetical protein